jgi:hypothetical protein
MRNGRLEGEPVRRDIAQATDRRIGIDLPGVIGLNGHSKGSSMVNSLERDFQGGRVSRSRPIEFR